MISEGMTIQKKMEYRIKTLPEGSELSAPMFFDLVTGSTAIINKYILKLESKSIIEFSHSVKPPKGGQDLKVYKKCATIAPNQEINFGILPENVWLGDMFAKPKPVRKGRVILKLTGVPVEGGGE